jgi:hypothetical protein
MQKENFMIYSLDGKKMSQTGKKDYWNAFEKFKKNNPDIFLEIQGLAIEYINKNPDMMVSNWWAKNILDSNKYKVTASLLGCIFWWTLSGLPETYISFQGSRELADENAAPLRKFFLDKQNKFEKGVPNTGQTNYSIGEMNQLFRNELMEALEYDPPIPFHEIADTELANDIWDFLREPENLDLSQQAVKTDRPVVENLADSLINKFEEEVRDPQIKQMIGNMVKQIMKQMGYTLKEKGIKCKKGDLFTAGATYTA